MNYSKSATATDVEEANYHHLEQQKQCEQTEETSVEEEDGENDVAEEGERHLHSKEENQDSKAENENENLDQEEDTKGENEGWMMGTFSSPLKKVRDAIRRQKEKQRQEQEIIQRKRQHFSFQSPTDEYRRLIESGNKLFRAKDELIPFSEAECTFPTRYELLKTVQSVAALAQEGTTKHFTNIREEMSYRRATLEDATLWLDPFEKEYGGDKRIAFFDLSITEGIAYKLVKSVLNKNIIEKTPRKRYGNTLVWYASPEEAYKLKEQLGIENSKASYVFLCDKAGRVRWTATGKPLEEELETLFKFTNELLKRRNEM